MNMKRNALFLAIVPIVILSASIAFAMARKPAEVATTADMEQLSIKCTEGGCPGGQGFCCRPDRGKLQRSLEGVQGVSQVIADKATRTFMVAYPKGRVALEDLQEAARQAGFKIVEAQTT